MIAADLVGQTGWIAAFCVIAAAATGWLSVRQQKKDGKTDYLAESVDAQHKILAERVQQIAERDERISALESDVRGLKRQVAELHGDNARANRRAATYEEKYDVALQEIISLRKQLAGD